MRSSVIVAEGGPAGFRGPSRWRARVNLLGPGGEAALSGVYLARRPRRSSPARAQTHRHAIFVTRGGALAIGGIVSRGSAEIAEAVARCERDIWVAQQAMQEMDAGIAEGRRRVERARVRAAQPRAGGGPGGRGAAFPGAAGSEPEQRRSPTSRRHCRRVRSGWRRLRSVPDRSPHGSSRARSARESAARARCSGYGRSIPSTSGGLRRRQPGGPRRPGSAGASLRSERASCRSGSTSWRAL